MLEGRGDSSAIAATPHPSNAILPYALGWASVIALGIVVEAMVRLDILSSYIIPPPLDILLSLGRVITEEEIPSRLIMTALEVLAAGTLMSVVGIPLGILLFESKVLRAAYLNWVAALASAPQIFLYPLFLVAFGRSMATIIAIGFLAGLPPIVLKTVEALSSVKPVLVNVGNSMGMTGPQMFTHVLIPASLPTIFTGVRLGLVFAQINVVGVEYLINYGGLGPLITHLAERYDLPGTYAAVLFVILISIVFFIVLEMIERWARSYS